VTQSVERTASGAQERTGYAALAREIRDLGLMERRPRYYLILISGILIAQVAVILTMFLNQESWWLLLLAPLFAAVSAQTSFIGHDAAHRQIARGARSAFVIGLMHGNLLSGFSYGWWVHKHNAHHAHPNDLDSDPDVAIGVFVFDADQANTRTAAAGWLTRHQAFLFFPMLLLEALNLHASSVHALLKPGLRHRGIEAVLLTAHFAGYATLLLVTMTWPQALIFLAIHQGLFGLYLGCSFAPSHKGMPVLSGQQAADPLLRQVLTSRNIRGGSLTGLIYGGLNLQIEHHLFPSMPRPNLRHAQPVVERFCVAHDVSYAQSSAYAAYRSAMRHLHFVGADLRG